MLNRKIQKIINEIQYALKKGVLPEKVKTGTFETYIMKDRYGYPRAIFKPSLSHEDNILREYAAYLLDYKQFAGVPETVITSFQHEIFHTDKKGSFQLFHPGNVLNAEGKTPVCAQSVRRIASLDIRLLNIDRNMGNFIIDKGGILIPIDHNLVLPSYLGECYFAWSDWKEAQTSFSLKEKKYLLSLNPQYDRQLLLGIGINPLAANFCYFATVALQIGVSLGLTAHQLSFFFEMRKSRAESVSWALPFFKDIVKATGYKDNSNFEESVPLFTKNIKTIFLQLPTAAKLPQY